MHTKWLPKRNQNYPKHNFGAAKQPPKGILLSLAFFRQPFCIYCIYFVYISYIDSIPPLDSIPPVINSRCRVYITIYKIIIKHIFYIPS